MASCRDGCHSIIYRIRCLFGGDFNLANRNWLAKLKARHFLLAMNCLVIFTQHVALHCLSFSNGKKPLAFIYLVHLVNVRIAAEVVDLSQTGVSSIQQ